MSTRLAHRIGAIAGLSFLLLGLQTVSGPNTDVAPNYELVFPRDRICRLDIFVKHADWLGAVRNPADARSGNTRSVPAEVILEGLIFQYGTLHFDRDLIEASEWKSSDRTSFVVSFDPAATFAGFSTLAFFNVTHQSSRVAIDLLRESGLASPGTGFMRIFLNHGDGPGDLGLYVVLDHLGAQRSAEPGKNTLWGRSQFAKMFMTTHRDWSLSMTHDRREQRKAASIERWTSGNGV